MQKYQYVCASGLSRSVVSSCLQPHEPAPHEVPTRFLCPWDSPGKNTGLGCHFLLQRVAPTQGSNSHLLYWQAVSLSLNYLGSPMYRNIVHHKNFCKLLATKNSTEDILEWDDGKHQAVTTLLLFHSIMPSCLLWKLYQDTYIPWTPWKKESESDKSFIHNFTTV